MRIRWFLILIIALMSMIALSVTGCSALALFFGLRPVPPETAHYVNEDYGFSIDYPNDWVFEQINPNEIGVKPESTTPNQIQITADVGISLLDADDSLVAQFNEFALEDFWDRMGATNLKVSRNERTSGKWDWVEEFSLIYEDTPLRGRFLIKETESTCYTATIIYEGTWPEGFEILDSFKILK